MQIQKNVSLAQYSTMRLGGPAAYLAEAKSEDELLEALEYAQSNNLSFHVIGAGSNSIFSSRGYNGLIIVTAIPGVNLSTLEGDLVLDVAAGENWDKIVDLSVSEGFYDIAALSLIPGTTGAAPVQNIGAYGQQISDSIESVRAYDLDKKEFASITKDDCGFLYRRSRFNTTDKGRFIITSVKMRLHRKYVAPPFYDDVSNYFKTNNIDENSISPLQLREAVSTVRVIKLPDPSTVANCGSFFKNPIVSVSRFKELLANFPDLKAHQTDDGDLKLYGAQLIELAGLKDYHDESTGMATWKNQALVLVNESAKSTDDLIKFKQMIVTKVEELFAITLKQEPEYIELV